MSGWSTTRVEVGPAGGFDVHSITASAPGPRVVVLGGVHGDETEGVLAAGRIVSDPPQLVQGRLDVVVVTHEAAFAQDARTSPVDGLNLARVFPGDAHGEPTARLAHHIYREVLEGADLLVDLHTSGSHYDMPFLAGYRGEPGDGVTLRARAAHAFGADFVWRHPGRSEGRTVSVVDEAIYVESRGSGRTNPDTVAAYHRGVLGVLAMLGSTNGSVDTTGAPPVLVTGGGDLDRDMLSVPCDGVFLTRLEPGDAVEEGAVVGTVVDPFGAVLAEVTASTSGRVMALKSRSPVTAGDLVICLAGEDTDSPL